MDSKTLPITYRIVDRDKWTKKVVITIPTVESQKDLPEEQLLNSIEISKSYDKDNKAIMLYGAIGYRNNNEGYSSFRVDIFGGSVRIRLHDGFSRISKSAFDGADPIRESDYILGTALGLIEHHKPCEFSIPTYKPSGNVDTSKINMDNFDDEAIKRIILIIKEVIQYGDLRYNVKS